MAVPSFGLEPGKPLKKYGRQSWQSDTGLPQNTVHAIAQTRDGFLWLATEGGLVRFDGQEFRTYDTSNTPNLPGDSIEGLTVDGRGTLWISAAGGLVRLDANGFMRVSSATKTARVLSALQDGSVLIAEEGSLSVGDSKGLHALANVPGGLTAEDSAGNLWVAAGHEVVSFTPQTRAVGTRLPVTDIGELQAIAAGGKDNLWVGGRDGLTLFRHGRRVPIDLHANVTAIQPASDEDAWVGTDSGLIHVSKGRVVKIVSKGVLAGRVERIFRDASNAVWVAFENGVTRINEDGSLDGGIDLPGVLSIFEDSEGDMWFGTDAGGVTILREQVFSSLTVQDGLSDDFVRAVFQDHAGRAWVGTNRGGLNKLDNGKMTALRAGRSGGLASNVVLAIAESGDDLWVGTPDGLSRLRGGKAELFTTANGLPDDFVRSLYADADGTLWIGTRAGLSHYAKGQFTSYSTLDDLGGDLIGSILRTHDGTLWVGTLGGVSRFNGESFKNFTRRDGLGGDAITAIAEDSAGTLWIAAHGAGLTRLRDGRFVAVPATGAGLPTEIYSVLEDRAKNLWLGTAKGVFRVSLSALNAFVDGKAENLGAESFGVADGMKISECSSGGRPAGWAMRDGSLWFATLKGVAVVNPDQALAGGRVPTASISQVAIGDRVVIDGASGVAGAEMLVPAGQDRVTIHYSAPSFQAPQKVVFRYMLEGFDRSWVMAGSRRTAYYTNIPAGTFRFLMEASNGNGAWSPVPGQIRVVVRPRFYRTWWFFLLLAVLLGGVIYVLYRLRVRSVESSYRAVLGERNRIAREIHDTLAQGYVGVSLQLEVVGQMLKATRAIKGEPGPIEAQIEITKDYVRSSLEDARSSIWNLRSGQTDREGETLPARLAASIRAKQEGSSAALRLTVNGTFRPLERSVEDEILRIGQEAVSNAVRHASANTIEVVLKYDTRWLEMRISDDGKGFARGSGAAFGHYGLQGMRERAEAIGAKLRIESSSGMGTTIEAKLGIAGNHAEKKRAEQG